MIPEPPTDTIPVREGEELPVANLLAYLEGKLPGDGSLQVRQFGGGAANLTYELTIGDRVYVLRRPPLGPIAPRSHDMAREHRILAAIADRYRFAPRVYLLCEDTDVIGVPFFVMERRHGVVVRRTMPPDFAGDPKAPYRMSTALIDALVELHSLDYAEAGLGDFGRPEGFLDRQVSGWWGRWERARRKPLATMDVVREWLQDNHPADSLSAIVHNDFKLDNCMLSPTDPGDLVAVFDWDMATIGDPLTDLGTLLAYWREPDDPPQAQAFSPMPATGGFPSRAELVDMYARTSGRDLTDVAFYHVLGLYRLAVILAQIYLRWEQGQTRDERFAGLWTLTELVADRAADIAMR